MSAQKPVLVVRLGWPWQFKGGVGAALQRHFNTYELGPHNHDDIWVGERPTDMSRYLEFFVEMVAQYQRVHVVWLDSPHSAWTIDDISSLVINARKRLKDQESMTEVMPYQIWQNPKAVGTRSAPTGWVWDSIHDCIYCGGPALHAYACKVCNHRVCDKHRNHPEHMGLDKWVRLLKKPDEYRYHLLHPTHREDGSIKPYYLMIERARFTARTLLRATGVKKVLLYGRLARLHTEGKGGSTADIDMAVVTDNKSALQWVKHPGGRGESYPTIVSYYLYVWVRSVTKKITSAMFKKLLVPNRPRWKDLERIHAFYEVDHLRTSAQFILWPEHTDEEWLRILRTMGTWARPSDPNFPESVAADALVYDPDLDDFVRDETAIPGFGLLHQPVDSYRFDRQAGDTRPDKHLAAALTSWFLERKWDTYDELDLHLLEWHDQRALDGEDIWLVDEPDHDYDFGDEDFLYDEEEGEEVTE